MITLPSRNQNRVMASCHWPHCTDAIQIWTDFENAFHEFLWKPKEVAKLFRRMWNSCLQTTGGIGTHEKKIIAELLVHKFQLTAVCDVFNGSCADKNEVKIFDTSKPFREFIQFFYCAFEWKQDLAMQIN